MNPSRPRRIGRLLIAIPVQVGRVIRASLREWFGVAFRSCQELGEFVLLRLVTALGVLFLFVRDMGTDPAIRSYWGVALYGVLTINSLDLMTATDGYGFLWHGILGILWLRLLITAGIQAVDDWSIERSNRLWHARIRAERNSRNSRARTR
jgi:hypothetical protein